MPLAVRLFALQLVGVRRAEGAVRDDEIVAAVPRFGAAGLACVDLQTLFARYTFSNHLIEPNLSTFTSRTKRG